MGWKGRITKCSWRMTVPKQERCLSGIDSPSPGSLQGAPSPPGCTTPAPALSTEPLLCFYKPRAPSIPTPLSLTPQSAPAGSISTEKIHPKLRSCGSHSPWTPQGVTKVHSPGAPALLSLQYHLVCSANHKPTQPCCSTVIYTHGFLHNPRHQAKQNDQSKQDQ